VGKDKHHAFMGSATGVSLYRQLIFENNRAGFSHLLKTTDQIMHQHGLGKVVYGLEPTGNYHKPLAQHLIGSERQVALVTGQGVKNNRQLLDGRWDKHDTKDAANIADLVSRGRCLYYDLPSGPIADLRALLSLRRRLKKEEHSLRVRIRNHLLAHYFPELDRFYSACESEILAIVKWCLDPGQIAGMDFERFFQMVTRSRRGTSQRLRLRKIHQQAAESVGCAMGEAAPYEGRLLVEKLEQVRHQLKATEKQMNACALEFTEYHCLLSIPGFGPFVSATVLAAIADPFRFENRKQLVRMAGYDLCASRSGKTSAMAIPAISKKGNANLRYALYQAAKVASGRVELFRFYFAKMLHGRERERGIITKMRVKLAAKLLVIAWTLMKRREAFDPAHLNIEQ